MQWIRLIMICCGMAMKRMGMLGVSVRKTKADCADADSDTHWLRQAENDKMHVLRA
jgi:hypothetical protein